LSNVRLYKSQHEMTPEIARVLICHFGKERNDKGIKNFLVETVDGDDDLKHSNIVLSSFLRNLHKRRTEPDEAYNLLSHFIDKGYTPNRYA
jgi:hypothetical protein